jgi:cytochrome c
MLGKPISPADLAPWDISIAPDGANLPPGKGTPKLGQELFVEKCAGCHGLEGQGQPAERLVGGQGTLTTDQPIRTVGSYWPYATTLFDYIRRAMPLNEPQSLTNDQVYSLAAYILAMNKIIGQNTVIDAKSLPKVNMPNRANFFTVYPGNLQ